jgi:beta-glucanase (GH16 family)
MIWTSSAISSTNHPKFICPSTGCYVQARVILADSRYGMWPAIWMMPESTSGSNGDQGEIDIDEGGFYWQGNSSSTVPVNQITSSTFHGTFSSITGYNGALCASNECQFNAGKDLSEVAGTSNWHIFGLEYVPNQKITVYLDGKAIGQWSGGIGSASYDVIFNMDVCYTGSLSWRTCMTSGQNGPYHFYVNDVQLYKLPGS